MNAHNPTTIAAPLGAYSHAIEAPGGGRWLHIAGQIGMRADGSLALSFAEQADIVWSNLVAILADAGMTVADLVKVSHYLVRATDLPEYNPVRSKHLGTARPASTLIVVHGLARAEWLIEVDAVAWHA
jgi:enamine deaminase RidA (YjgF/YER057c/UK114 family)